MPFEEYFRANRVRTVLGIRLTDLRAVMDGPAYADNPLGGPNYQAAAGFLLPHVVPEPLHIELRDQGYTPTSATPDTVAIDVRKFYVSGGMNELPTAVVSLAHGRDAGALARGVADRFAVSPAHVIERFLNSHVRARLFHLTAPTSYAGFVPGDGDNDLPPPAPEWVVVFDGYLIAPSRRGSPEDHSLVVHMTHVLAGLSYSSTVSATVAAGTGYPAAFNPTAFGQLTAGAGTFFTAPAAAAAELAGGTVLYTDFWGYRRGTDRVGVKGFLTNLAGGNAFAAETFLPTLEGRPCDLPLTGANDLALTALDLIEPVGRVGDATAQDAIAGHVRDAAAPTDRGQLINAVGVNYYQAGYRYGVPVPFKLEGAVLTNEASRAFASDVTAATVESLGPLSFWDLLANQYPARYQVALCPRAGGAVVAPAAPVLGGWWQTIHASEVHDWGDDIANPYPVRGVVLVSSRAGISNALTAGVPTQTNPGSTVADGGYDSCQPGVIVYRDMPAWLVTAARFPGTAAPATINGPRTTAALAAATGAIAVAAAPSPPDVAPELRKTANRLAKALYQHVRLLPRTLSLTGRFRTDIAPGSTVRVEVPTDRFVRAGLGSNADTHLVGLVTRVVLSVDVDAEQATTQIQLGFVRLSGELRPAADNPLYGTSHPFWNAVFYGHPWCDSAAARTQIGSLAAIGN